MTDSQNRKRYRELCGADSTIPLFSQDWWLDAVCIDGEWDVALIQQQSEVKAALPYYLRRVMGLRCITMPKLTQTMGPWFAPMDGTYTKRLSKQMSLMKDLIDQLPSVDMFHQGFAPEITNWLPFYWAGYQQSTSYTYVIDDISDPEKILQSVDISKRGKVKKATRSLTVDTLTSVEGFYATYKRSLRRRGKAISYPEKLFVSLGQESIKRDCGKIFCARDQEGGLHAALYVVWGARKAYNLVSLVIPGKNTGAMSLVIYQAICFLQEHDLADKFDFEGSMIPGVEQSYRYFGTLQTPYFQVWKKNIKARLVWNGGLWLKRKLKRQGAFG